VFQQPLTIHSIPENLPVQYRHFLPLQR